VHFLRPLLRKSSLNWIVVVAALAIVVPRVVQAEALLVVEADTGKVLQADNATYPWYPASVTKLMTAYVTLKAVKDGRISLDTLLTVSPVAAAQSPSKMGFRPGTQVTVDNALKMMLVKSANDMAVVLAEGIGGSIDGFSAQMNQTAQRLGMTQSSYVNPNGLPAEGQITSARDLAILARAIIRDLPEYEYFVHIPSIRFGRKVTQNFNKLIGRYPGADGFKTGFICASGYNLVASATRNGKRLIAVVPTTRCRGCAPRSAPSTIWCQSTPRRRTCATRCAGENINAPPATRMRTPLPATPAPAAQAAAKAPLPFSPPACSRRWRSRRNCWPGRPRRRSQFRFTPVRPRPAPH
jgi:D-alanyl-D-alanine carboxypeptidase